MQKAAKKAVLVVGRWQPFHLGHLRLMRSAFRLDCPVIIVIGSSNVSGTMRNPLTANERAGMIRRVLSSEGMDRGKYAIVPVRDIGNDVLWLSEVERKCSRRKGFDLVMTGNLHTAHIFRNGGYRVIRPRFFRKKECNATRIRSLIHTGKKWEHLVPKVVLEYLNENGLVGRIRDSRNNEDPVHHHQNCHHGRIICKHHRHGR